MKTESITNLRSDGLLNPIGIDGSSVRLTWQLPDLPVDRIQVRAGPDPRSLQTGEDLFWDSGRLDQDLHAVEYRTPDLPPLTPVYWSVRCWRSGEARPSAWANSATFEKGLGPSEEAWAGSKWIARSIPRSLRPSLHAPLMRGKFTVPVGARIVRARLSIATPGFCYAWLNGTPVMSQVCDPMRAESNRTIHYRTIDVSDHLAPPGEKQLLAIWLASGFYSPWNPSAEHVVPVVRSLLTVQHEDGSTAMAFATDGKWKTADGPVELTQSYSMGNGTTKQWHGFGGERWDLRQGREGWSAPGYDDSHWENAEEMNPPSGRLTAQTALSHIVREVLNPVTSSPMDKANRCVVDFGKTITGRVRLRFRPKMGLGKLPRLRLRHAEVWPPVTPNGSRVNAFLDYGQVTEWQQCPGAMASDPVEWAPLFHIFCFRYVEIEAVAVDFDLDHGIQAEFISTDIKDSGSFETDDPLLMQIEKSCAHTWRCLNLYGASLDCSHREKCGYGSEMEAVSYFFLQRFDSTAFARRHLQDWRDVQHADGRLPYMAPDLGVVGAGGPYWGHAPIQLAWNGYLHSGDLRLLSENFDMASRWSEHLRSCLSDGLIDPSLYLDQDPETVYFGDFLSDWLPPRNQMDDFDFSDFRDSQGRLDLAGDNAQAFLRNSRVFNSLHALLTAKNVRNMALTLGEDAHADRIGELVIQRISRALIENHVDRDSGKVANGRTSYAALALVADPFIEVLDGEEADRLRDRVRDWLVHRISNHDERHFDTGVIATTYLLKALMLHGEVDLALDLLQQKDFPSFGNFLQHGYDTIPERWAGDGSSFCHASFTGAAFWFYEALGGLRPLSDTPGYRRFELLPQFTTRLAYFRLRRQTAIGEIYTSWEWCDPQRTRLSLTISLPSGSSAHLTVPSGFHLENDRPSIDLGSGTCTLTSFKRIM